ncbi:MAG: YbaN family protein, partial [Rhizobiaceae bacterium]|nr:YbaN family protein [Rhizobiaceae bacterium]
MRIILLGAGWIMVAVGIAGIFLPVLPTTPFMILAAALFARSSPRFEQWLLDHPRYGKPL